MPFIHSTERNPLISIPSSLQVILHRYQVVNSEMRHYEVNSHPSGTDDDLLVPAIRSIRSRTYRTSSNRSAAAVGGMDAFELVVHRSGINLFKNCCTSLHPFRLDDFISQPDRQNDLEVGAVY
jgi:hypothetical protein